MRISGFVVLVVCLLCTATAASAASSAVGACSCIGAEQGIPMHTGYWGYRTQYSRAREMYGVQRRSVVVRRAPYQAAQAPRYRYGGRPIVQQPAVQYWTYQAQYPRVVRQAYRGQRRPVVDRRATQAPRYAYGGDQIVQHPSGSTCVEPGSESAALCEWRRRDRSASELIDGKSNEEEKRRAMRTPAARSFSILPAARRGCSAAAVRASRRSGVPFAIFGCVELVPVSAHRTGRRHGRIWGTRHVAIIRQYNGDGTAVLYDANSGKGLTRVHRVRIAGLAVVDPHPGRTLPTPSPLMVIL